MKKYMLQFLLLLLFPLSLFAQEPTPNLSFIKKQLIQYYESGEYEQDIQAVTDKAEHYLAQRVAQNNSAKQPEKLAIVFDIDETMLSSFTLMKRLSFGLVNDDILRDQPDETDRPIRPVLALYHRALHDHVAVFIVTGRHVFLKDKTIQHLKAAGFTYWNTIYFKPNNFKAKTNAVYKSAVRKHIDDEGYRIIINIGDQDSDLKGNFAEKAYKLPNPFYYIP